MDNWKHYAVHLGDELPGIGSGLRHVEATTGRKWVFVRTVHTTSIAKAMAKRRRYRMTVNKWKSLGATPWEPNTEGTAND